ncbi:Chromate resistance protein ChrB [Amycolatopsis echigonensis]
MARTNGANSSPIAANATPRSTRKSRAASSPWRNLEEEEQRLERPGHWHRDLKVREVFSSPSAAEAEQQLNHCAERHADCPERVSKPDVPRGFTMYADLASPATTAIIRCGPEAG